jgi:hypothetical protein
MYLATDPPGFGCRERLTRTQPQPKGTANMSAKALAVCSFEPAAEQTVATDSQAPEGIAAAVQFREDLWREYRREAINAGLTAAQATEYASALSPEMGLIVGVSEMAPVGRGWFYQSRAGVVRRTLTSELIQLRHCRKSKTAGRIGVSGTPVFARWFRPWNAGGKS